MKILAALIVLFIVSGEPSGAQNSGEQLFKSICSSCHTINKGRLVGPDLTGIYDKKPAEWLTSFIRSSQTMVKSGDADAVAIFNEFNKIPMPDNNLSNEQILSILDYIKSVDQGSGSAQKGGQPSDSAATASQGKAAPDSTAFKFTPEMVQQGSELYHGIIPFIGGAAPCYSCHNITGQTFLGGGKLAFDLTRSYTKLGYAGIQGILMNPPFPAMKAAIPDTLTRNEINSLIALLKSSDDRFAESPGRSLAGLSFFIISFVIAVLLVVHIYLFYDNRKIPEGSPGKVGNKGYLL
ncbi:MAG TPA: cytochrome c [Bacteroidales bacterium]|nr:cytochrome c [Bacteroidales bacterium]